ncbi:MAG: serine hydrolase [Gammaproteobacteria bacterium]|nr:serine hydrolase [Gammaproteobacteria bacterium]MDE0366077.1 serine hydrolase [Gammaproteobacteria bacterium]
MSHSILRNAVTALLAGTSAVLVAACGPTATAPTADEPAEQQAEPAPPGTPEYVESMLARVAQKELDRGLASLSVAIIKDGEVVFAEGYGYANVAQQAEATPDTYYISASTFKPVTSTALLTLVDQGKCGLDDPVNDHLGDIAVKDDPPNSVTIRRILDHTSGLSDEHGQSMHTAVSVWDAHRTGLIPAETLAAEMTTVTPAGETWRYNNTAYMLAGLLIERISGMPYEQYVVENVLKPAGIDNGHPVFPSAAMVERMAVPYVNADGERNPTEFYFGSMYPAGLAYVTPSEMAKFLWVHLNGGEAGGNRILSNELVEVAHTPYKEKYGLGWWTYKDEQGHTRINHGGTWYGYVTTMVGDKDNGIAVYAATNTGPTQGTYRLADAAVRLTRGEEISLEDRQPVEIGPAILKSYEGLYLDSMMDIDMRIEAFDGGLNHLVERPESLQGYVLEYLPASETVFFNENMGVELHFQVDEAGGVTGYRQTQHGWIDYGIHEKVSD